MKSTLSVTVESSLISWIDEMVATGKYRNRSHLTEQALERFKANEQLQR